MAVQAVTAMVAQSVAISTKSRLTLCAFATTMGLTFVFMLVPPAAEAVGKVPTVAMAAAAVALLSWLAFTVITEPSAAGILAIAAAASVPISDGLQAVGVPSASTSGPTIAAAAQPLANALQTGGINLDDCTIAAVDNDKSGVVSRASCELAGGTTATFRAYDSRAMLTEPFATRRRRMARGDIDHHRDYYFRHGPGRVYTVIIGHRSEAVWWIGDGSVLATMTRPNRNSGALLRHIDAYAMATYPAQSASSTD